MKTPQYYVDLLTHMSVNKSKSMSAPHKAIMLLTIIDMIEAGEISSPYIPINTSLKENFKRVWDANVPSNSGYQPKMSYPFFYLSSSPFWELVKSASHQGQTEYSSMAPLERDYSGAIIDVGLFRLMKDSTTRDEIKTLLKSVYLGHNNSPSRVMGVATLIALICSVA